MKSFWHKESVAPMLSDADKRFNEKELASVQGKYWMQQKPAAWRMQTEYLSMDVRVRCTELPEMSCIGISSVMWVRNVTCH